MSGAGLPVDAEPRLQVDPVAEEEERGGAADAARLRPLLTACISLRLKPTPSR